MADLQEFIVQPRHDPVADAWTVHSEVFDLGSIHSTRMPETLADSICEAINSAYKLGAVNMRHDLREGIDQAIQKVRVSDKHLPGITLTQASQVFDPVSLCVYLLKQWRAYPSMRRSVVIDATPLGRICRLMVDDVEMAAFEEKVYQQALEIAPDPTKKIADIARAVRESR